MVSEMETATAVIFIKEILICAKKKTYIGILLCSKVALSTADKYRKLLEIPNFIHNLSVLSPPQYTQHIVLDLEFNHIL